VANLESTSTRVDRAALETGISIGGRKDMNGNVSTHEAFLRPETESPIDVPERLSSPLPVITRSRDALRSATMDEDGLVHATQSDTLAIRVAPQSIGRCLRIADALLKAWEALGGTVDTSANDRGGKRVTTLRLADDSLPVSISETTERSQPAGTGPRDRRHGCKFRPTGRLMIQVESWGYGERRKWADGNKQRLENILRRVLDGLLRQIELERLARLDKECQTRQREQVQFVRTRSQRMAEKEAKLRESLLSRVNGWHQAKQIRAYARALQEHVAAGSVKATNPDQYQEWLDYVAWYADSVDPFVQAPPRPEQEEKERNLPVEQLDLTSRTGPIVQALGAKDSDELYQLDRRRVEQADKGHSGNAWTEICRVLEGLGYDMSGRTYFDYLY
jgi:hypothetical protein